jgi:3'(2'), 5'-bisphosphate nucleotidase
MDAVDDAPTRSRSVTEVPRMVSVAGPTYDDADQQTADAALALELAAEAGSLLVAVRTENAGIDQGDLKALGDRSSQDLLARRLAELRPGDAVLSEEAADDRARLTADRVWIVDPLDGTREFSEGRHDWAVHVALWAGGDLVAGAVALPGLGTVLGTHPAPTVPAGEAGTEGAGGPALRMAVSRTRPPALAERLTEILGLQPIPMGSAGYKVAAVVRGEVDLYVHAGGQYEWDSAAPVAVALAAGLHASRIDGSRLRYNQPDVLLPDLLVCRPELADQVLATIAQVLDEDETDGSEGAQ